MTRDGRMRVAAILLSLAAMGALAASRSPAAEPAMLKPINVGKDPQVFAWTDTCNVYVIRDGDAAVLIDLGDGSVLDQLGKIGVRQVEWVLFTHHHREQCQGAGRLAGLKCQIAAPAAEKALFEQPENFRRARPSLGDPLTIHGSSYVRPPIRPIRLDRTFGKMDTFAWRGREFWCLGTPGNSPGGMSYVLMVDGRPIVFSGDVMLDGGRMHTWFDTEWDYGFAAGLYALAGSVSLLEGLDASWLLPSHGPPVREPSAQLGGYQQKLRRLGKLYVRGYEQGTFGGADQDTVSRPTDAPHIWRITKHLYKPRGHEFWPNFTVLIADSGRALVVDCGLDKTTADRTLGLMQERLGLKGVDAVFITHIHGDHVVDAPHLRQKWGAKLWTLEAIAERCRSPRRYNYAAMPNMYGAGIDSVEFDRAFRPGEKLDWEGYAFTVDWMPGQTKYGCCLHGRIDGRLVAFTGDNIFANPADPAQNGHEAVVAHNDAVLEEGYMYAAEFLTRLQPDLLVGGHSWVMDKPAGLIRRYRDWSLAMRDAFREVSAEDDYRCMFDPFWVCPEPYRVDVEPGGSADLTLHVRNFRDRVQEHRIEVHAPDGIAAEPAVLAGRTPPGSTSHNPLRLKVDAAVKPGVRIVAFDTTVNGKRYGEWFDVIVCIGGPPVGR